MRITITIPDQVAADLLAQGLSPEIYLEKMVQELGPAAQPSHPAKLSMQEFNASLDALARYSDKIPSLPIEAVARASFYENHD